MTVGPPTDAQQNRVWIKIFDKSIFWLGDDNVVGTNIAGPEILNPEFV